MRFGLILVVFASFGFWSAPAAASPHDGCNAAEAAIIDDALATAKDLTLAAAVAVGDTRHYARWFGVYSSLNAEKVRASLKTMASAIRSGAVTVECNEVLGPDSRVGCAEGEYAWVFSDEPYLIHLCPSFFDLPSMAQLRPRSTAGSNGTRAGTIIHELSHFFNVAETEDHCYTRRDCSIMARTDPGRAIENADSYQYFSEDVSYYARQPLPNKPPSVSRP